MKISPTYLAAAALLMASAAPARADTLWIEAEDVGILGFQASMTSPLRMVERADASNGSSMEVVNGLDSKTTVPATGQACYTFDILAAGTYKVWGRVIARTVNDDSFWVRMDAGSWIQWNEIAPGESWHWDFVHNDVTPTTPITFSLSAAQHTLCFAYREDDTRLDAFVVTSDTSYNPNGAISGAPAPTPEVRTLGGSGAILIGWRVSLGATSYTLERRLDTEGSSFSVRATGLTGGRFHDTGLSQNYCYRVRSVGSGGTSAPSSESCGFLITNFIDVEESNNLTLTPPMQIDPEGGDHILVAPGNNSLSSAPSTGYARWDFKTGSTFTLKFWGKIVAPSPDNDSFWVRMDHGTWIKWNNLVPGPGCEWDDLHNSDAGGALVNFTIGAGVHALEIAYREEGTELDRLLITNDLSTTEPGCFD
jgi:hypothetical protein